VRGRWATARAAAGRSRLVAAAVAGALGCGLVAACSAADDDDDDAVTPATDVVAATTTSVVRSELDTPGATAETPGLSLEDDPLGTSTVPATAPPVSGPDPAIAVGGADAEGDLAVSLDVNRFTVSGERITNAGNPYHEIATVDTSFTLVVELYPDAGLGWDGSLGQWPTDCVHDGICVYFDRDGAGDEPTLVAAPEGVIDVTRLDEGGYAVTLIGLRFPADDGGGYRLSDITLATP
jgi:hypothetical protein